MSYLHPRASSRRVRLRQEPDGRVRLPLTIALHRMLTFRGEEDFKRDSRLRYVPAETAQEWLKPARSDGRFDAETRRARFRMLLETVGLMHRAGVPLLAGSRNSVPLPCAALKFTQLPARLLLPLFPPSTCRASCLRGALRPYRSSNNRVLMRTRNGLLGRGRAAAAAAPGRVLQNTSGAVRLSSDQTHQFRLEVSPHCQRQATLQIISTVGARGNSSLRTSRK